MSAFDAKRTLTARVTEPRPPQLVVCCNVPHKGNDYAQHPWFGGHRRSHRARAQVYGRYLVPNEPAVSMPVLPILTAGLGNTSCHACCGPAGSSPSVVCGNIVRKPRPARLTRRRSPQRTLPSGSQEATARNGSMNSGLWASSSTSIQPVGPCPSFS